MAPREPLQPLFLLSDEPIFASEDDGLSMQQTARVIAETALGAATPFTIGIFGAWGQGKTSLLNAARTLLEPVKPDGTIERPNPHVVTVQFNAWRYEKEEHPIVPLVASIAKAVKQRLDDDRTFTDAVGEKGKAIATTLYDGALSLISAVKLEAKGRLGNPVVGQAEGGITLDAGAAQKNYAERIAKRKAADQPRIQSWIDQSLYLSAFDDLARLHAAAKTSGANQTGQAPLIVVFIDDLDRCRPEAAVEILEGIKLVLAQPGFVFVLALYREVIERYLDRQCELRYGEKHKGIGEGYIDKIVQLPLWLPSHEATFEQHVRTLVTTKLRAALLPANPKPGDAKVAEAEYLLHAIDTCVPLLARLSGHSPRKVVRKINELLIDDRLLPHDVHEALGCQPGERRAVMFPVCLIQRALLELPLPQQIKPLLENDTLCAALATYRPELADTTDADGQVAPMLFRDALKLKSLQSGLSEGKPGADAATRAPLAMDAALSTMDAATAARWLRATDCLSLEPSRAMLLNTTAGRAWLANHAARRLVAKAISTQSVPLATVATKTHNLAASIKGASKLTANIEVTNTATSEELRQQVAIIEREARRNLNLKADAPLGPTEFARVTTLNLVGDPITDAGAAWLARAETSFKALTTLDLDGTQVTDAGVKELARAETGLKALTSLNLWNTRVTDAGVKELARAETGLKALTTLDLDTTAVTDAGVKELARAETGLKALTKLDLNDTQVTDDGVKALAHAETGLKALTTLNLGYTQVTDAGVKELARAETGLKVLTTLNLGYTQVTDAGVKALAHAETGLKALTSLNLSRTQVTEAGVAAIKARFPRIKIVR